MPPFGQTPVSLCPSLPHLMLLLYNMILYKKVKKNSITEQDTEQTHQTPKFHLTQLDKQMLAT